MKAPQLAENSSALKEARPQAVMSSSSQVQIRPWNLSDSDFVMDGSQPLDPRKTIFVGGVPRPLRAGKQNVNKFCFFTKII